MSLEILPRHQSTEFNKRSDLTSIAQKLKLAEDEHTLTDTLEYLSQESNPVVRRAVASNRMTPRNILQELQNDPDISVRQAAKRNLES